jgi:hypothetical protein
MTKKNEIPTIDTNALKTVTGGCAACRQAGSPGATKPNWWNNAAQPQAAQ